MLLRDETCPSLAGRIFLKGAVFKRDRTEMRKRDIKTEEDRETQCPPSREKNSHSRRPHLPSVLEQIAEDISSVLQRSKDPMHLICHRKNYSVPPLLGTGY